MNLRSLFNRYQPSLVRNQINKPALRNVLGYVMNPYRNFLYKKLSTLPDKNIYLELLHEYVF